MSRITSDGWLTDPTSPFIFNPEYIDVANGESTELPVQYEGNRMRGGFFFILFSLVFFIGMGIGLYYAYQEYLLATNGELATGIVTSKDYSTGDDSTSYYLYYNFAVAGTSYADDVSVDQDVYNRTQAGNTLTIRYNPNNPESNTLDGKEDQYWQGLFALIPFFIGMGLLSYGVRRMMSASRVLDMRKNLEKRGQIIDGQITASKFEGQSAGTLTVSFEFVSPRTGKHIRRTVSRTRDDLYQGIAPSVGQPLKIYYATDRQFLLL